MNKRARVVSQFKGGYVVRDTEEEFIAKITGKQMFNNMSKEDYPAVGDWVLIDKESVIKEVLLRESILKRVYGVKNRRGQKDKIQIIATNIDIAFVVESVDRDYNLNRFERYFAMIKDGGITPAIIINKIDLIDDKKLDKILKETKERFPKTDIILTSTTNDKGIDELKEYIKKDKTYCFLGSSGVGKSSLINKLLKKETIRTEDISSYHNRGKHTTTKRQMYFLENGGMVIDNPGIREVGIVGMDDSFEEINSLSNKCKYDNCTHIHESGCAILHHLKIGKLDQEKYSNYINLKKESDYQRMTKKDKKEKDRRFGKVIKREKNKLKNIYKLD